MTVRAIYENGVFRPVKPVALAENAEVDVVFPPGRVAETESSPPEESRSDVFEILSHRYRSGKIDIAARHNEHHATLSVVHCH
jgi:predicted DNA-binding antitoxin AbrB/MazE fold protein